VYKATLSTPPFFASSLHTIEDKHLVATARMLSRTDGSYVWHSPDWDQHRWWEGTGAVWRAPDFNKTGKYVINYSRCPGAYVKPFVNSCV